MQSEAKTVAAYVREAPFDRRQAVARLRDLCVRTLKGYTESMVYGMPGYERDGIVEVGFASQKNYISLYILRQDALAANRARLKGLSVGKGCIRYPNPASIDFGVVRQLLIAARNSKGKLC